MVGILNNVDLKGLAPVEAQAMHERLLNRLYYISLAFGAIAYIALLPLYPEIVGKPLLVLYAGIYLTTLLIHLLRKQLPYQFRAFALMGAFFTVALFSLVFRSSPDIGIAMFCIAPIIAVLIFDVKAGMLAAAISFFSICVVGVLTVSGVIDLGLGFNTSTTAWTSWISLLASASLVTAIALTAVSDINQRFNISFEALNRRARELDQSRANLELEVNERKLAEKELLIKNTAMDSTLSAVAFCNLEGRLTYANDALVRLWGYANKNEMIGKSVLEFCADEQSPALAMEEVINNGQSLGQMEALRNDGTAFTVRYVANMIYDKLGKPLCMMGIFDDITEQTRIKAKLTEENAWRKVIQQASSMLNTHLDFDSSFKSVASALRDIIPVDHMMIILKKEKRAVFEVVETRENTSTTIQTKVSVPYEGSFLEHMEAHGCAYLIDDLNNSCKFAEEKIIQKDGLRACARLPLYDSGNFLGMLALSSHQPHAFNQSHLEHLETLALHVAHTVANIQRYEQVRSNAERLALIVREVHHRIKNNLQGVIGLLSRYGENQPELATVTNAAISQLYSVAEVHNLLSNNTNETIGWHALIQGVCQVTNHLSQHHTECNLTSETSDLMVTASEAVPMALVLNELIQNAINHGYPDGRTGEIRVSADLVAEKEGVRLVVANDGDPPPHTINNRDHDGVGIGLELIRSLLPDDAEFRLHRKHEWTLAEIIIPAQSFII